MGVPLTEVKQISINQYLIMHPVKHVVKDLMCKPYKNKDNNTNILFIKPDYPDTYIKHLSSFYHG